MPCSGLRWYSASNQDLIVVPAQILASACWASFTPAWMFAAQSRWGTGEACGSFAIAKRVFGASNLLEVEAAGGEEHEDPIGARLGTLKPSAQAAAPAAR
jgi:hypothetical protein